MQKLVCRIGLLAVVGLLALGNAGCLKKMLLDGQLASTRKAAAAANTISDWEVALRATSASLTTFEGLHYLAPYNEDGLFLLTKGWAGVGYGFIEDEMQQAQDKYGEDSELAQYHLQRAVAAYSRAIFYGSKLLELRNPGFKAAQKNAETMREYLKGFEDKEVDPPNLFWLGQAWLSRVNLLKDQPEVVADLFIGVELIRRAVALNPEYNHGMGHSILGMYHARTAMAELDESKKQFEAALKINGGKALLVKFAMATKYYCAKTDKENYVKLLTEIVEAGDVMPEQRLQNTIAKRRARRFLTEWRMDNCGFR